MASPVLFISGPNSLFTPGNLSKLNTGYISYKSENLKLFVAVEILINTNNLQIKLIRILSMLFIRYIFKDVNNKYVTINNSSISIYIFVIINSKLLLAICQILMK